MKKIMLGNEAVARGLYEAGCRLVSSYPGTPSTEITEFAAKYDEVYAEWAPNEKVALETALGGAIAGGRTFCAMKHVGLNVAADPLFVTAYTGINGGMVICVADDPGMHSSQNEQDSRNYAIAAKLPMLVPSNSMECLEYTKLAYELSEKYDVPFLLGLSTRVSHSQSIVEIGERKECEIKEYVKAPQKYVMMPGNAKKRHPIAEQHLCDIKREIAEDISKGINTIEWGDTKYGIITSGVSYCYSKEALGNNASYLKLGMVNPMPDELIRSFAEKVDRLIVIEELDTIIENHCKALGLKISGRDVIDEISELSPSIISEKLLGKKAEFSDFDEELPARPPVMCPGCPHRGVFYTLKKLKLTVSGDIGCYTLGAVPPLAAIDTTLCMGASISALHGFNKVREGSYKNTVAVIGDSTFIHSGVTGLMNITYNQGVSTVIILDNRITGMTGHQQNPTTGYTLKGAEVPAVNIEKLCEAAGVNSEHIKVVDPIKPAQLESVLKEELAYEGPSVIIARRPCALLKYVKRDTYVKIDETKCKNCRACMAIGCPAISAAPGKKPSVDPTLCTGCMLCAEMCRFGAIDALKKQF